jgi:hypothetical protein
VEFIMKAATHKGEVFVWFSFRASRWGGIEKLLVFPANFLACENIHVDVQADLDRQGEECGGASTSYVSRFGDGLTHLT